MGLFTGRQCSGGPNNIRRGLNSVVKEIRVFILQTCTRRAETTWAQKADRQKRFRFTAKMGSDRSKRVNFGSRNHDRFRIGTLFFCAANAGQAVRISITILFPAPYSFNGSISCHPRSRLRGFFAMGTCRVIERRNCRV